VLIIIIIITSKSYEQPQSKFWGHSSQPISWLNTLGLHPGLVASYNL